MANKGIKMSSGPCHNITAELFFDVLREQSFGGKISFNLGVYKCQRTCQGVQLQACYHSKRITEAFSREYRR